MSSMISMDSLLQWNLNLMKCQRTGPIGSLYRGSLYQKSCFNELVGKQPKCLLYRGIVNNIY